MVFVRDTDYLLTMTPLTQFMLKQFFPYAVTIVLGLQINDLAFLLSQNIVLWLLIVAPIWVALCYGTRFIFWKAGWIDHWIR
ncbi:MAG: hypothetical protein EBY53_03120 [Rhodobacteraceae bacterium]|nr:hypothetical protein [Paracoccaceae bacterium]